MSTAWQLQEAKNRLSQVVDRAVHEGPQVITVHGKPTAVLLSVDDYRRLARDGLSLTEFFAASPLRDLEIDLERNRDLPREVAL